MRKSMLLAMLLSPALAFAGEREAAACGGCFGPPAENDDVVTDHRMVLSISKGQTTLYDQIKYSGSPSSFAWVLPITGTVQVGISSNAVFDALDQVSQTQVVPPPPNCPPPPDSCKSLAAPSAGGAAYNDAASDAGVTVTHEEVVGPYETVQLHSTDANALESWLATNGFAISDEVKPIVAAYVHEGSDFLAMKLVPGAGIQEMRPVRVSCADASHTLPLRMVAAGTGAKVGITLWVVASGRLEPQNFPLFRVDDSEIVWDWTQNQSNYRSLRQQKEDASGGRAWEIEASLDEYAPQIRSQIQFFAGYGGYGGGGGPSAGGDAYEPIKDANGNVTKTAQQVMQEDMDTLFAGIAQSRFRLTRMRADLAHAWLANDLSLQAAQDQGTLSNIRRPGGEAGSPSCPVYGSNCSVVGFAPRDEITGKSRAGGFSCSASGDSALGEDTSSSAFAGIAFAALALAAAHATRRRKNA